MAKALFPFSPLRKIQSADYGQRGLLPKRSRRLQEGFSGRECIQQSCLGGISNNRSKPLFNCYLDLGADLLRTFGIKIMSKK